jgi:flagellar basal body-associated protein FliL
MIFYDTNKNNNNNNNKNKNIIIILIVIIFLILLFRCLYINNVENFENLDNFELQNKYVCMYAYYEKNNDYKENFKYFLDNVILKKNNIDYYIIINGECTLELPNETKNIKMN